MIAVVHGSSDLQTGIGGIVNKDDNQFRGAPLHAKLLLAGRVSQERRTVPNCAATARSCSASGPAWGPGKALQGNITCRETIRFLM